MMPNTLTPENVFVCRYRASDEVWMAK